MNSYKYNQKLTPVFNKTMKFEEIFRNIMIDFNEEQDRLKMNEQCNMKAKEE